MSEDRIVTSHELEEELKLTEESVFHVATGFKTLDDTLKEVEAGELVVVSGPTGNGKTTFLMSMTKNMSKNNVDTVWFTLEVTSRQFISKLVRSSEEGDKDRLPLFFLPRRGFEDVDAVMVQEFEKAHRRKFEMIDWIEVKIEESIARAKGEGRELRVVFIDHIHMIFSLERVERNISLEIGDMVAKIKQIALSKNLVVFLVAHSKDDPQGTMREPRMQDIRDSGLISRLADTVIGIWRIPNGDDGTGTRLKEIGPNDNKSKIRVWKNRREGQLISFTAYCEKHYISEAGFGAFE